MIRVTVELPGGEEEVIYLDITNIGPVRGWPEGDGTYASDGDPSAPPIPGLFNYKVRGPKGTRYFMHTRSRGWKECVRAALGVAAT